MSVEIKYKGNTIASASTDTTKTIKTSGKYCEGDIEVVNTPDSGDAPVINPLSVTANGTYTAPSGVDGYSPVTVNVPQGITPTGNINITDTNVTDVTNYATAQVVDADLIASNIKEGVNILGVVGTFEGGGGGDIVTPWYTVKTAEVVIGANSVNNPQTAAAYFEGIVGEGNVIAVFLKNQKTTYGTDELVAMPQHIVASASNIMSTNTQLYRMRNNVLNVFSGTSGYGCYIYEGAKYAVIYYDTKP